MRNRTVAVGKGVYRRFQKALERFGSHRLKWLIKTYGLPAFIIWNALFFLFMGGFLAAFLWHRPWTLSSVSLSLLVVAHGATVATYPIRLAITLAITPIVCSWLEGRGQQ